MERNKIPGAAFVILRKKDEVLLMRRCNTGYEDGNYDFPAGHIEQNEHPSETAIREIQEEAGVSIEPHNLTFAYLLHRCPGERSDKQYLNIYFTASEWQGEPRIMEPTKCDHMAWFPIDALPENLIPSTREAFKAMLKGETYGEE
jgi:mutator protein MutT